MPARDADEWGLPEGAADDATDEEDESESPIVSPSRGIDRARRRAACRGQQTVSRQRGPI
jgi:hypothetical protein